MSLKERTFASEKGAVFVQVGISIFVMMAFNVFVLDYGMMWVGRRQAQNAADAGALAAGDGARLRRFYVAAVIIWHRSAERAAGRRAEPRVATGAALREVLFTCPAGVTGKCVQVNVYRNGQNGSTPLPTLFGPIFGINEPGRPSDSDGDRGQRQCDELPEAHSARGQLERGQPAADSDSTFKHYSEPGGAPLRSTRDTYVAPSATASAATRCPRWTLANGVSGTPLRPPRRRPSRTGSCSSWTWVAARRISSRT